MGMAAEERQVSNAVRSPGVVAQGGHGAHGPSQGTASPKPRVPGFPQDMMMPMDDAVAKPETYGMAKDWTAATQGMMTLVRVLPPDQYDEVMRQVEDARNAPPKPKATPALRQGHQH
jgi:hypothetical protein